MSRKPLVSICCLTYCHKPYISQCIEGFLMQETSFEYEIIIHDDHNSLPETTFHKEKPYYYNTKWFSKEINPDKENSL